MQLEHEPVGGGLVLGETEENENGIEVKLTDWAMSLYSLSS